MTTATGHAAKSVASSGEQGQQGTSEESLGLEVSGLPLGHESSKTSECSAEWMVNQEPEAVQKLKKAVQPFRRSCSENSYICSPVPQERRSSCRSCSGTSTPLHVYLMTRPLPVSPVNA